MDLDTPYNLSDATRVFVTASALGVLCFAACRWHRPLGLVFCILSVTWACLFPFYWVDWIDTPRAVREYGKWRHFLGIAAAGAPLLLVGLGCWRSKVEPSQKERVEVGEGTD